MQQTANDQFAQWKAKKLADFERAFRSTFERSMPYDSGIEAVKGEGVNILKCPPIPAYTDFERRLHDLTAIYGNEAVTILKNSGAVSGTELKERWPRLVVPYANLRRNPYDPDKMDWPAALKAAEKWLDHLIAEQEKINARGGITVFEQALIRAGKMRL